MTRLDDALAGLTLWPHHRETIEAVVRRFETDPVVEAVLLGGSLVHGFATERSDVDIVIVVTPEEHARRAPIPALTFYDEGLATYDGGYVDGKFVSTDFLRGVAERGGDATRWGYENARILFSRDSALPELLDAIVAFPAAEQAERMTRFTAQVLAWQWYYEQGLDKGDRYLQSISLSRVVLFACRLVLTANGMLYPFHKWMLRVTATAPDKPAGLMADIASLLESPGGPAVAALVDVLFAHYGIDRSAAEASWGAYFMRDTELTWLSGAPPIDDL